MAKRPNLGQITSSVFTVSQLNTAYDKIDTAFDNTLSRDGSTPNTMLADLDMNSNDILNVGVLDGDQINVNEAYIGGKLFTGTLTWRSDWLTATSYQELDLVKQNGNVYVALEEHTSGVFASDLSALRWELFVENATGPAGPTGDTGATGPAGQGVPTGGTTGQVLAKIDGTDYNTEWVDSSGGSSDHGALTGLGDDDHTQYHNNARGDARYYTQTQLDAGQLDTRYFTESEVTSALSGKADTSHTHTASQVTDFSEAVDDRVSALLVAGTDISLSYNDASNTLTITSTASGGGGGGGTPGGSNSQVQYNDSSSFAGAANVEIEDEELRLVTTSTPTAPSSGGLKVLSSNYANHPHPHYMGPSDPIPQALQPMLAEGNFLAFFTHGISNYSTYNVIGAHAPTIVGSMFTPATSAGTPLGAAQRTQIRYTSASTSNCASFRIQYVELFTVNGAAAGVGGFKGVMHSAPGDGCTNSSHRYFMGMMAHKGSIPDQDPSAYTDFVGIGYDDTDTELQFMHNDSSGTATKVALGASFPKPSANNSVWYKLRLYCPPGTTRTLSYEVIELISGAVASGTVTTDLPSTSTYVAPVSYTSVGGVSSTVSHVLGNYAVQS